MLRIDDIPRLVINLPERGDRLKQFRVELGKLFDNPICLVIPGVKDEIPERGIIQAHKNAILTARAMEWDYVLVMEDDLKLSNSPRLKEHINECLSNLPNSWDALSGSLYCGKPIPYNKYWNLVKHLCGCHFMIYTKSSYDRILNLDFGKGNYDRVMSKVLDVYVMAKLIAKEHSGYSDHLRREVDHDSHTAKYKFL